MFIEVSDFVEIAFQHTKCANVTDNRKERKRKM